jgi:TIR domain
MTHSLRVSVMTAKVFLSLSYVDRDFAAQVRSKLPSGLAYFYEESFENGELLLAAMERAVKDAAIFVLFASKKGQESPWVKFEIDQARLQHLQNPNHRVLVFPTDPNVVISDLPAWMRAHWIPRAGYSPADVARYITTVLLEPNVGVSTGAIQVVGRGKTPDRLTQLAADHFGRFKKSPAVYFLTGFRGVGRRTFSSYFMRNALSPNVNLPYGPVLPISAQADLADIHRALRTEISPTINPAEVLRENDAFRALNLAGQVQEVIRLMKHFFQLGQAVTVVTSGGFFEDKGEPKEWVMPLFDAMPDGAVLFAISNRHIPPKYLEGHAAVLQMRVEELTDKDVRALMVFTAKRLRVENFSISDSLVQAIGGHADVANAAVRLAAINGVHVLERDPKQLFDVQNTILIENIEGEALTPTQRKILCLLSWVPAFLGNLLEKVLQADRVPTDEIIAALENLILSCLVVSSGANYAISPSIRLIYRRFNPTPAELIKLFSKVLSDEWEAAKRAGQFRIDLFDSFVFMHALEGTALPKELVSLLTPGTLFDVIRDTYARGKDAADKEALEQVISWGKVAEQMKMSEATREEILSTATRAHIRLGDFDGAGRVIGGASRAV